MRHNPKRRYWLRMAALAGASTAWPLPTWGALDTGIESYVHDVLERLGRRKPETLRVLAPEGSEANLAPMISAFTKLTGIATALTKTPVDDINSQLLLSHLTQSTRYDVAVVATFGIPDLADAKAILPIDRYERRFPAGKRWRESSLFARGDSFDNATYGPQVDGDLYVMFYNNALLQDPALAERHARILGRPLTLPRTWSELDDLMRVAHQPDEGINGGLLYRTPRYIAWEYWARLHAAGLLPFTRDMHPAIAEPPAVDVLTQLVGASASLHSASDRLTLFQNWAAFTEGNTLCNIGWGGSQKHFCKNEAAFPAGITVTQLPGRMDGQQAVALPYFNWGWNLAVPSTSAVPELAYLFGVIATMPDVSTAAVRPQDGFFDPFRPEHYDDDAIIAAYGRDFLDVHRQGLTAAIPDLYIRGQGQYLEALSQQLVAANRQQVRPQRALENVARQWESITHRLGRKAQVAQWQQLLSSYPPAWRPV